MTEYFNSPKKMEELIKKFEKMLTEQESFFFDLEAYTEIIQHYKHQNALQDALKACELATRQYPFSSEVYLETAQVLLLQERYQAALEKTFEAQRLNPQDVDTWFVQANIYYLFQDYTQALEILLKAEQFQPEDPEIAFRIGFLYLQKEEPLKSLDFLFKALELDITHEEAMQELLHVLEITDRWTLGIDFFDKKIDENPYNAYAWFNSGLIYAQKEEFDSALQAFEYATIIQKDFSEAHFQLGHTYMNQENFAQAYEAYSEAYRFAEEDSADLLCCLGASLEKQSMYLHAMHFYKKAMQIDNLWADAWHGMGCCLVGQEKYFEALHFLKKATQLELNATFWISLAQAEQEMGNFYACVDAYEKAANIDDELPELWLGWSFAYFEQGEENKAMELIEEGIGLLPDEALLYYYAAAYFIEAGRFKQGFNFLENALILDFEQHEVLYSFFPDLQRQKALFKVIEQYRNYSA